MRREKDTTDCSTRLARHTFTELRELLHSFLSTTFFKCSTVNSTFEVELFEQNDPLRDFHSPQIERMTRDSPSMASRQNLTDFHLEFESSLIKLSAWLRRELCCMSSGIVSSRARLVKK